MAKHLDLEEQEQLDQLKAFWARWGTLVAWVLIIVLGSLAAYNGWQYWQRRQAQQAAVLYDEVERAVQSGELQRLERAVTDIQDKFGRTPYAQQAGLLVAKVHVEKGNTDAAKTALSWVGERGADEGLRSIGRLRLASVLLEAKAYDEAMKALATGIAPQFEGIAADRRGDILQQQGKAAEATAEYRRAFVALEDRGDYRRLIEVKLNAMGVDPRAPASEAAKP